MIEGYTEIAGLPVRVVETGEIMIVDQDGEAVSEMIGPNLLQRLRFLVDVAELVFLELNPDADRSQMRGYSEKVTAKVIDITERF